MGTRFPIKSWEMSKVKRDSRNLYKRLERASALGRLGWKDNGFKILSFHLPGGDEGIVEEQHPRLPSNCKYCLSNGLFDVARPRMPFLMLVAVCSGGCLHWPKCPMKSCCFFRDLFFYRVTKDKTRKKGSWSNFFGTTVNRFVVIVVWDGSHSSSRLKPAEAGFWVQSWGQYQSRSTLIVTWCGTRHN